MKTYRRYLKENKKEKFVYVIDGKITDKNFSAERTSNQTLRSRIKIDDGYIEDKYGHRYANPMPYFDWFYYSII